jgi:transcriptional regulator of acetoin/glycerol metabolism
MSGGGIDDTITSEADHRVRHEPRAEILVVCVAHAPACRSLYPETDAIVRVGRRSVCDLQLDDAELSGDHCGIVHLGGNAWRVTDYGTKNGTWVGPELVKGGSLEIEGEDLVVLAGGTVMILGSFDGLVRGPVEPGPFVRGYQLNRAFDDIANTARAGLPLLIAAETGAGKEEAIRHAYRESRNKRGALVTVNCSAIASEELAQSTLFGIERNVASGVSARPGLFAEADRGVLVLDEVHTLPRWLQPKLLRVLQDGTFRPVGGAERKVDVQLVSVTNTNLKEAATRGEFPLDLYHRLAGKTVRIPPLRERLDEVSYLVTLFANMPVHADFIAKALRRSWPGHVRELEHATKSAAIDAQAAGASRLRVADLAADAGMPDRSSPQPAPTKPKAPKEPVDPLRALVRLEYLKHRSQKLTAEATGVPRSTVNRWLIEDGLIKK